MKLSIVVVVHRMSRQAENTLYSLSPAHQRHVDPDDYELIVVENESDDMIGEERAVASGGARTRYLARPNDGPVQALAAGVASSSASLVGIVIDGARMASPRIVHYALAAFRINSHAVVSVPGYHLGRRHQHDHPGYGETAERALLDAVDWRTDGYRLFPISVYFNTNNQPGYLMPMLESNCLFLSRADYDAIGGVDVRFASAGGGLANLDLYRKALEDAPTELFVLPGEGTFHQFHGGVTTRPDDEREEMLHRMREEYLELKGRPYAMPDAEPRLLGTVTGWALPDLYYAAAERAHVLAILSGAT